MPGGATRKPCSSAVKCCLFRPRRVPDLLGPCSLNEYRRMLRASTVHVYLTAPYALSTGILEAMSCGVLVVGSDTAPVREVLRHGSNGFLCDFWDAQAMSETVASVAAPPCRWNA